jgi:hypothetical protein
MNSAAGEIVPRNVDFLPSPLPGKERGSPMSGGGKTLEKLSHDWFGVLIGSRIQQTFRLKYYPNTWRREQSSRAAAAGMAMRLGYVSRTRDGVAQRRTDGGPNAHGPRVKPPPL